MKVAVLWFTLTGYINSSLRALAARPGVDLMVVDHVGEGKQAPFADEMFGWIPNRYVFSQRPDQRELLERLEAFKPDILLVASWSLREYREACRRWKGRAVRIVCMDNQWEATLKQYIGQFTAPFYVQRLFEAAFVSGERQAVFARRLGFAEEDIWRGLYCADTDSFALPGGARQLSSENRSFLFAGRLVPEKGLDTLVEAYAEYRKTAFEAGETPWTLRIVGSGSPDLIQGKPGIEHLSFVQPDQLPALFAKADCFVLPSRWEPWAVVLHEAAAASLPIICTSVCGASVHFLWDGYNGYVLGKDHPSALAQAFLRLSRLSPAAYAAMALGSYRLSQQLTTARWAEYVYDKAQHLIQSRSS